ncbi:MAG: hypothetical protein AAGG45_11085 [Pseudomonadota bacterium]
MAKQPKAWSNRRALWIGGIAFVLMFPALYIDDRFGLVPFDGILRTVVFAVIASFIAYRIVPFGYEADQENEQDTRR